MSDADTSAWPNHRVLFVAFVLSFCSSLQNGFISSVLNIPHEVIQGFVNESNFGQQGDFVSKEGSYTLWTTIVSQRQVGQIVGVFLAPFLSALFGRKGTVLVNTCFIGTGLVLQLVSKQAESWVVLLLGRLVWATGCGVISVVIPMFISEIAPTRFRGGLSSMHGMMIGLGSFLAYLLGLNVVFGTFEDWPNLFLFPLLIQLIQFIILPLCPDSPKDLFVNNQIDGCMNSLKFYHGSSSNVNRTLEEYKIEKQTGAVKQSLFPFKQLWQNRELRMSILVGMGATCAYAFAGMHIMSNYTTELFKLNGIDSSTAAYVSLSIGVIRFVTVFPSIYAVERYGRRPLLLTSSWGCAICFTAISIVCYFGQTPYDSAATALAVSSDEVGAAESTSSTRGNLLIFLSLAYTFLFSMGAQTVGTFLPSELVPTQQRSAVQSICVQVRYLFALVTGFVFYPLMATFPGGICFIILIIPLLIISLFMHVYMPETRNRAITDIIFELNTTRNLFRSNDPWQSESPGDVEVRPILGRRNTEFY